MIIQELKSLIDGAPIEEEEKAALSDALGEGDEDFQKELAGIASERPEILPYLYINLAAKKYAIAKNDPQGFKAVVEHGKEYFGLAEKK